MRAAGRLLISFVIISAIALAIVPAKAVIAPVEKTECCAKMKAESAGHECERHAPKPDPDKQCCSVCALCLAGVLAAATPFVYPPVGNETFAAYVSSEHTRSQRPPVPPPRA